MAGSASGEHRLAITVKVLTDPGRQVLASAGIVCVFLDGLYEFHIVL
jgi:hypothetical protein